ncbi:MAG: abhydrolase domain-containing 18 [Pseudomonadales bacterium]|nr:abhydrolase domain-containing 18 [Pseudomonadales bacterium]
MGIATNVSRVANATYSHTRKIMPEQPWWDNLETSFHKFPDDFELDLGTQLLVDGTVAVDVALRTAVASVVSCLALPLSANPFQLLHDLNDSEIYREKANTHDPAAFFQKPLPGCVEVKSKPAGFFDFHPKNGRCEMLYFDSPFMPVNPRLRERYRKNKSNLRAVAQYWRHNSGPKPTICVIHGFMADPYWVNRAFLALPWFYDQGYDILLYTLPHHGARRHPFAPFSGHGYFAGGISNINETVAHSVYDFRIFLDYLLSQGAEKVGVTGISLGGYTSALLAAVEERLYFSIPNVPVVSLFDLMLQWFPASAVLKTGLRLANMSTRDARHMMAVHCPLTYDPLIPKERLMIIGGAGDRLAPPKHSRILWDHWDRCRIHWFPGNHVIHFDRGKYLREISLFLKQIKFHLK